MKLIRTTGVASLSVTGTECALSCRHCSKIYLRGMLDIKDPELASKLSVRKTKSILVSGGSDASGAVPFYRNMDIIRYLKEEGYLLNLHTGVLAPENLDLLTVFDTLSIDIIGDGIVLSDVYNLNIPFSNHERANATILDRFPTKTAPHITIGLVSPSLQSEEKSVDFLTGFAPRMLILNVFIPTRGTPLRDMPMTPYDRISAVVRYAREKLPDSVIYIGCMRPFGEERAIMDERLLREPINGIVNPAAMAVTNGEAQFDEIEGCCAMV